MIDINRTDKVPAKHPVSTPHRSRAGRFASAWLARARVAVPAVLALLCLGATVGLARYLDGFTPVATWMIWKLARVWFWGLMLAAGCIGFGSAICRRALRDDADCSPADCSPIVRAALAIAIGATVFGASMYLAGALHLFHPVLAVALPLLGIAFGLGRSPMARLGSLRKARLSFGATSLPLIVFGALSVGLIFLHVLDPEAPNHDAHWTHIAIAQDYAREGHLAEFRAEWAKNFPHFASLFYTWAFLVPGLNHPGRMLLVMHTELLFLIGTLVGVAGGAHWLSRATDDAGERTAWVAFFLFPSIFVYDSNLGGSADHIAAMFMVPMFLAIAHGTEERFSPGLCAIGGALAGAAFITKYQSVYLTAPLAVLVAVRLGRAAWRRWRGGAAGSEAWRAALLGVRAMLLGGILASCPFFLENLWFHHNPVYPFMQQVFSASTPSIPNAPFLVSNALTPAGLQGNGLTLGKKLADALGMVFLFPFQPHYSFLGARPYFGFLFTLLSPLALLLPGGHRLRIGALVAGGSVFAWAMTYLVDRNLQIILPMLVAVTAGVIVAVWRLGWIARIGIAPLILLQVAWGGDLMFQGDLAGAIEHIRSGLDGKVNVRETSQRRAMTRVLPKNAKVLLHADLVSLGLDREVLSDEIEYQGLIDYPRLRTPREAYDRFHAIGVTHLVWTEATQPGHHMQRDIIFNAVVRPLPASTYGPYLLVAMPATPPPATSPYRVLALGGLNGYRDGIYRIDVLSQCEYRPPACQPPIPEVAINGTAVSPEIVGAGVDAVIARPGYGFNPATAARLNERFRLVRPGGPYDLYLQR